MKTWIMSFSDGKKQVYNENFSKGVAAMGTYCRNKPERVIDDCRKYSPEKYEEKYNERKTNDGRKRNSLFRLAYEVGVKDVVYARKGFYQIVGRGVVTDTYAYDPHLFDDVPDLEWEHFVRVNWDPLFKRKVDFKLASQGVILKEFDDSGI
jgi:hypothetical protein